MNFLCSRDKIAFFASNDQCSTMTLSFAYFSFNVARLTMATKDKDLEDWEGSQECLLASRIHNTTGNEESCMLFTKKDIRVQTTIWSHLMPRIINLFRLASFTTNRGLYVNFMKNNSLSAA